MRLQDQELLAGADGGDGEGGGIGAIEDVGDWHIIVFAARRFDQGAPPTAAGEECSALRGQQGHRVAVGEHGAGVGEAVDDDSGVRVSVHCAL